MRKVLLLFLLLLTIPLSTAALTDGLLRAFTFDNAFSNSTYTISQVGDGNGTVMGGALNGTDCLINECYTFDGVNDAIDLGTSAQLRKSKNFSISLWANRSAATSGMFIIGRANLSARDWWIWLGSGDSNTGNKWEATATTYTFIGNTTNDAPQSVWTHLVMTVNDTDASFWVNGTLIRTAPLAAGITTVAVNTFIGMALVGGSNWTGQIDELYIYNRSITSSEIGQLYNNGTGSQYPFLNQNINVDLVSPLTGASLSDTGANFTVTYTPLNINLTNATYFIWLSNGSLFNQTTVSVTGQTVNTTRLFIDDFTINNYIWNVRACGLNSSASVICSFAAVNNTFDVSFSFTNTSYNAFSYESEFDIFNLTITTFPTVISVSGKLIYNGTSYNADSSCISSTCYISSGIDIPLINTSVTDLRRFQWNITQFDGSTSSSSLTPLETHNTTRIFMQGCTTAVTVRTLNFTAFDEENLSRISPFSFIGTFNYWLGHGTVFRNQSFNNQSTTHDTVCINPGNETFYHTSLVTYTGAVNNTYVTRDYYFTNATANNNTQNIPLFLLAADESTTFIQEVLDDTLIGVSGALIYIQRYYPEDNQFRTVQVTKTDTSGKTVGFYKTEDVDYKHIITLNNTILLVEPARKIFVESLPATLRFLLGNEGGLPWQFYNGLTNLVGNISHDPDTELITFTYIDTSGSLSSARLLVEKENYNSTSNTICNVQSVLASATLVCNVSGIEGVINSRAYIGRSPEQLVDLLVTLIKAAKEVFGKLGYFLGIIIVLAAYLVVIPNLTAGLITGNAVLILVNATPLMALPPFYIFAISGITVIAIVMINKQ